jgi:hypothetical protein
VTEFSGRVENAGTSVDIRCDFGASLHVRTTIVLDDDAIAGIKAYAREHDVSMGKAASELIRRGARFRLGIRFVHGIPVLDATEDFPAITSRMVSGAMEEE